MTVGFYILKQLTVSRFHSLSENLILSFSTTLLNVVSGSPSDRTPDLLKGFGGKSGSSTQGFSNLQLSGDKDNWIRSRGFCSPL